MNSATAILVLLAALVPVVIVFALFLWAAKKDGQADRALQERIGIRRRTRLGR